MELIKLLTSSLDIEEGQASGGAGLLLQLAKDQLGDDDFSKVAEHIPGIGGLIEQAPAAGGIAGALGGLASSFGGDLGQLGNLASLAGGFSELGLDTGKITQFIPIILSFVQNQGGDEIKELLENVLK